MASTSGAATPAIGGVLNTKLFLRMPARMSSSSKA
jgi:hypothetical protein